MKKQDQENAVPFNYRFKDKTVHKAFKLLSVESGTSIQELISSALKAKYKDIKQ